MSASTPRRAPSRPSKSIWYTKEGTFKAFEKHLPRLKELGVDILWFMPVYPIGEVERKGELGSYYSIRDYKAINPEFGDIEDFQSVVDKTRLMSWASR